MKTAMQQFIRVIDVRIEKTTNEQSLKILKMVRTDLDMFLEIEQRQIIKAYEKGFEDVDGERYYKETYGSPS